MQAAKLMLNTRLYRARKALGLSLRELGKCVGVSSADIRRYEDGIIIPSSDILIKLAQALKVRTEYFLRPETLALEYRNRSCLSKLPVAR